MSPLIMYMTSSLGSEWNSLRPTRPRATNAIVSGACQRMLTGLTLFAMPSETSLRLTDLSSVMEFLRVTEIVSARVGQEVRSRNFSRHPDEFPERRRESRERRLPEDPGFCAQAGAGAGADAGAAGHGDRGHHRRPRAGFLDRSRGGRRHCDRGPRKPRRRPA